MHCNTGKSDLSKIKKAYLQNMMMVLIGWQQTEQF